MSHMHVPLCIEKMDGFLSRVNRILMPPFDLAAEHARFVARWKRHAPPDTPFPPTSRDVTAILRRKAARSFGLDEQCRRLFYAMRGSSRQGEQQLDMSDMSDVFNDGFLQERLTLNAAVRTDVLDHPVGAKGLLEKGVRLWSAIVKQDNGFCSRYYKAKAFSSLMETMMVLFDRQLGLFRSSGDEARRPHLSAMYAQLKELAAGNARYEKIDVAAKVTNQGALMLLLDTPATRAEFNEMAQRVAEAAISAPHRTMIHRFKRKAPPT